MSSIPFISHRLLAAAAGKPRAIGRSPRRAQTAPRRTRDENSNARLAEDGFTAPIFQQQLVGTGT